MTKYIGGVSIDTVEEMKQRHPADFYPTEQTLIDAYIERSYFTINNNGMNYIADLGAGDGRWGRTVKNVATSRGITSVLTGIDIRDIEKPEGFDFWQSGVQGDIYNFANINTQKYNVIVGNPPYSILEDWLDVCFQFVNNDYGTVALLLSLNALAGKKRYIKYYSGEYPLSRLVVFSNPRPSFSGNGKTYPGREYGMFEWIFHYGQCLRSGDICDITGDSPIEFLTYERNKN